ncbi:unnamed protein product [Rangifer tarandus platyrhynchus]|uniref:Uncharacterized protein n=1 Tax=Rangifer tarandus platyrhynchus TaxID=3082113 RepID=A0AC59YAD6_RANTA
MAPELTPDRNRVREYGHLDPPVLVKLSDDCGYKRGQYTHQIANPQNHKTQPALRYTQPLRPMKTFVTLDCESALKHKSTENVGY